MATQVRLHRESTRTRAARIIVAVNGWFNLLTGLILLFAPGWFYANVADFPLIRRSRGGTGRLTALAHQHGPIADPGPGVVVGLARRI
jgi:hypothetical protein